MVKSAKVEQVSGAKSKQSAPILSSTAIAHPRNPLEAIYEARWLYIRMESRVAFWVLGCKSQHAETLTHPRGFEMCEDEEQGHGFFSNTE